jgi:WD40 repeat protein
VILVIDSVGIFACVVQREILLWNFQVETPHVKQTLSGHERPVQHLLWLESGFLASSSGDCTIKLWGYDNTAAAFICSRTIGNVAYAHGMCDLSPSLIAYRCVYPSTRCRAIFS